MRKSRCVLILSVFLTFFLPINAFSWNALGHMVIASIAYQNLEPKVRDSVDELVSHLRQEYSDLMSFQQIASWPDALRFQHIETFAHWHYVDNYFSLDGTQITSHKNTDNAMWALDRIKRVVKNPKANPYERARFLAFLVHVVGDLHQPLHTVAQVSEVHPKGDMGGNLYYVRYNNRKTKLHSLWDGGVGIFNEKATPDRSTMIANRISSAYSKNYFGDRANALDTKIWMDEGMKLSRSNVYTSNENETVSQTYIESGRRAVEQQAALAGYRLAAMLNVLLSK